MHRFRLTASGCLRACALLLTLLSARADAQAQPNAVTIAGTFQSELGCPGDWEAACATTHLERDPVDGVWRKLFLVPGGPQAFKAAINDSWDENYGAHAELGGPDLHFSHTEAELGVKFFYDPATHWVTNSTLTSIAVLAGSMQSELGCASDWAPACMLTWLKDVDGDGVQELVIPSLPANTYALKVAHHESWDENYGADGVPNGADIGFTVPAPQQALRFRYDTPSHRLTIQVAAPTATTLGVSPSPARVDAPVTLTATVAVTEGTAVPVGTVTFKVEGADLGTAPVGPDGTATLTVPTGFRAGTFALTAEYRGMYEPSLSVPVVFQVGPGSVTTLTVSPSGSSPHGAGVLLHTEVRAEFLDDGRPDGEVTWRYGDTVLGTTRLDENGNASLRTGTLPVGELRLSAVFSAEAPFLSSRAEVLHTVTRAPVEVFLVVDAPEVPMGLPFTLRAGVRRRDEPGVTATGTVAFVVVSDEGMTQPLGTAPLDEMGETRLVAMGLPMGTYRVRADYSGDALYLGQQSLEAEQRVTPAASRTTLTASPTPSVYGQPVDIRLEVRPVVASIEQTPSGAYLAEFRDPTRPPMGFRGQLDVEGRARVLTPPLNPGDYSVSATYQGGGVFAPSTSPLVVFTVLRGPAQVSLGSSRNPSDRGEAVTFTAQVSAAPPAAGTPEGNVTFLDGTTPLTTVPVDAQGVASYTTVDLEPGEHALTVTYAGSSRFEPGTSATLAQVVRPAVTPDAGPGETDAGSGETDAGSGGGDAGSGDTDAGTSTGDSGSTPGDSDAGTQAPDAGTGNPDAGTTVPLPSEGDEGSGCGCGAGSGGSPLLLLGMWMGLTALQSRRRSRR